MQKLPKSLIDTCRAKLLENKQDILNRVKHARENMINEDNKGGDEGDQTVRALAETEFLSMNERMREKLVEIEMALARIENGSYGLCEETEETIEEERLVAIPWTRLSIEGAELRESVNKRFAR